MLFFNDLQNLIDDRNTQDILFHGEKFGFCYTWETDCITQGKRENGVPFTDRLSFFEKNGEGFIEPISGATLSVSAQRGGVAFSLSCDNPNLSEWGLSFPFNFMSKKNGGGYQNQFLLNSPYITADRKIKSFYLTKPNGNNLLLIVSGECDGWQMEYYQYHFMKTLKIFGNFDKAYGARARNRQLTVGVYPVGDYENALQTLSEIVALPCLSLSVYSGKVGGMVALNVFGDCDGLLEIYQNELREVPLAPFYQIARQGVCQLIPTYKGKRGAGVTVYGYSDLVELYARSMDRVDLQTIATTTDGNLCEHQCWASATLRLLQNYPKRLTKAQRQTYENRLHSLLERVMQTDESKAVPRLTILNKPYEGTPAYNIFKSNRIQEQFFGITLFLDAYRYFKEERFLTYAIGTTDCLIAHYQGEDGGLETVNHEGVRTDYSTVCCGMIPLVDMANHFKGVDDGLYERYASAATRLAEHILSRGFQFSTEGEIEDELLDREMEDGSISCSALSLLYYCKNLRREEGYLQFAKVLLDFHDTWVMNTPLCNVNGSTLRWWETLWEGDKDGPALCCGHAWTIWRAEADWLYYALTKDERYKNKALNGFGCNFAKIDGQGDSYAVYTVEDIVGGGFGKDSAGVEFRLAPPFPQQKDFGLSRYVWIRANDSILSE